MRSCKSQQPWRSRAFSTKSCKRRGGDPMATRTRTKTETKTTKTTTTLMHLHPPTSPPKTPKGETRLFRDSLHRAAKGTFKSSGISGSDQLPYPKLFSLLGLQSAWSRWKVDLPLFKMLPWIKESSWRRVIFPLNNDCMIVGIVG